MRQRKRGGERGRRRTGAGEEVAPEAPGEGAAGSPGLRLGGILVAASRDCALLAVVRLRRERVQRVVVGVVGGENQVVRDGGKAFADQTGGVPLAFTPEVVEQGLGVHVRQPADIDLEAVLQSRRDAGPEGADPAATKKGAFYRGWVQYESDGIEPRHVGVDPSFAFLSPPVLSLT